MRKTTNEWTDQENEKLRRDYPTRPAADIAAELPGRTRKAVIGQANRLKIRALPRGYVPRPARKIRKRRKWRPTEDDLLCRDFSYRETSQIARKLGRTQVEVEERARKLNLVKPRNYARETRDALRPPHVLGEVGDRIWFESCDRAFREAIGAA
jgi:hypothetical protein